MPKKSPPHRDISMLHELQSRLRRAVVGGDTQGLGQAILGDGLDPAARVRIYRHHALATLGNALRGKFPVVCRLVGERFFAFAADRYLSVRPPASRCLVEYGADFPEFLAGFTPCADLPYLADVARLEWALCAAAARPDAPPLALEGLATIPLCEAPRVVFRLQPSLQYVASPWPIDAIWRANQQDEPAPVDLDGGGRADIEIRRAGTAVVWRKLDPPIFAFRSALAEGRSLAAAISAAMPWGPDFDATMALRQALGEGLAVGFAVATNDAPSEMAQPGD
jgi:Putative DNA-binding domain